MNDEVKKEVDRGVALDVYVFHTDPGHGWLAVNREELERLGILYDISEYSYQRGVEVYLEEDSDAVRFLKAKEEAGEPVTRMQLQNIYTDGDHACRKWDSFNPYTYPHLTR